MGKWRTSGLFLRTELLLVFVRGYCGQWYEEQEPKEPGGRQGIDDGNILQWFIYFLLWVDFLAVGVEDWSTPTTSTTYYNNHYGGDRAGGVG